MKSPLYQILLLGLISAQAPLTAAQNSPSTPATSTSTPVSAAATSSSSSSPDYTITALPAVKSQPPCIYNCMIPIGLADPSGCDDVSNDCACLSAPGDVLDFLTSCVQTVCHSSTAAYAATATSLYGSYCRSVYGTASFSQAIVAESSAAAASSGAGGVSSTEGSPSMSMTATTPSPTARSLSVSWKPSLITASLTAVVGVWVFSIF